MKKLTKAILGLSLTLVMALTGCKTGMFAPRTGQLFQTTRMCPGPGSFVYTAPLMVGVWGVQKSGGEWTIPIGIVGLPIAAAGFVVDECVVSPLVDLVCLPYDLCQPKRSFYIRVVDEFGKPISGVKVWGDLIGWNVPYGRPLLGILSGLRKLVEPQEVQDSGGKTVF